MLLLVKGYEDACCSLRLLLLVQWQCCRECFTILILACQPLIPKSKAVQRQQGEHADIVEKMRINASENRTEQNEHFWSDREGANDSSSTSYIIDWTSSSNMTPHPSRLDIFQRFSYRILGKHSLKV